MVGDIWYFITLVSDMDEGMWIPSHHLLKELESKIAQQVVQKGRKLH
jgi:hypothetical protein